MGFDRSRDGKNSVYGLFGDRTLLQQAIDELRSQGLERVAIHRFHDDVFHHLEALGFPIYEARRYESLLKNGGILLSVLADDFSETMMTKQIMQESGAHDISLISEEVEMNLNLPDYQAASIRSRLDPFRLTDI